MSDNTSDFDQLVPFPSPLDDFYTLQDDQHRIPPMHAFLEIPEVPQQAQAFDKIVVGHLFAMPKFNIFTVKDGMDKHVATSSIRELSRREAHEIEWPIRSSRANRYRSKVYEYYVMM